MFMLSAIQNSVQEESSWPMFWCISAFAKRQMDLLDFGKEFQTYFKVILIKSNQKILI
jgi:hypothetical protein